VFLPLPDCVLQWSVAHAVDRVHFDVLLEQHLDYLKVAFGGGDVEWSSAVVVADFDVAVFEDEALDLVQVSSLAVVMECFLKLILLPELLLLISQVHLEVAAPALSTEPQLQFVLLGDAYLAANVELVEVKGAAQEFAELGAPHAVAVLVDRRRVNTDSHEAWDHEHGAARDS